MHVKHKPWDDVLKFIDNMMSTLTGNQKHSHINSYFMAVENGKFSRKIRKIYRIVLLANDHNINTI